MAVTGERKPEALKVLPANVPDELARRPAWLVWKYVPDVDPETGETEWDKPPLCARGGPGSSTNRATWSDWGAALAAYERGGLDGVGLALWREPGQEGDGLVGLDLDGCRAPLTGELQPWAAAIVREVDSYAEASPSGRGIRIFLWGKLPPGRRKGPRFECYETGRYVTVTGHRIEGTPATVERRQEQLLLIHGREFPPQPEAPARRQGHEPSPGRLTNQEVVEKASAASNGGKFRKLWAGDWSDYRSRSEADLALVDYLAFWCRGDQAQIEEMFAASGLFRSKWNRADYRKRTYERATRNKANYYDPRHHGGGGGNGNGRHAEPRGDGDAAEPEEDRVAHLATLPDPEPDIPLPEPDRWPEPPAAAAYHGLAGEIVRLIAPQTEADPVAILVQILVMYGSAIGRRAYWPVEADKHYGNLFAVLVGDTAVGRKGVSKGRALSAFGAVEGLPPQWIGTGLSSGEGLIWAVRDAIYKLHHVKKVGRVIDTQTVLEDNGIADKRLLVIEPEFASPLRVMRREGNTLSARLREAWDDGNLRSMTKNTQARSTNAHISLLSHVTRQELLESSDDVSAVNGLYNRFLWLAVKRSQLLPLGGAPVNLSALTLRMADAVRHGQESDLVWLTESASRLFSCELYGPLTSYANPILNRAASQVRRLAMLYALLDFASDVDECHLRAAVALWDYCERSVRWIFGRRHATGDKLAAELLTLIRARGGDGISQTDIGEYLGRHVRAVETGRALASLLEAEAVRFEKVPTKGRSSRRWFARVPAEQTTLGEKR